MKKHVLALILVSTAFLGISSATFAQQSTSSGTSKTPATTSSKSSSSAVAVSHTQGTGKTMDKPVAILGSDFKLQVPADKPLSKEYRVDVSKLNFKNSEQMEKYFSDIKNEYLDFKVNKDDKSVVMALKMDKINEKKWQAADLNKFLATRTQDQQQKYSKLQNETK